MTTEKRIAVITGASSGLGREFIKELVLRRDVDEYWLIARRTERLQETKAQFPDKKIVCLSMDLTDGDALKAYAQRLAEEKPKVVWLLNNAGFGKLGAFAEGDVAYQAGMVDLNCRSLTVMTSLTLPYMDRGSRIVNTASIAAFAPNAFLTVYSSTKAYVLSFSRGLGYELKKKGITVTAICPGPMETEFLPVAGIEKGASKAFDTLPYCKPNKVAKGGLKAAEKGRSVYTPTFFFRFYRLIAKLFPTGIVMHWAKA